MALQENLASVMRAYKQHHHQSLTEFADYLEISRSTLQEYINGTGNPRIDTLEHLATKLDLDPMILLSGTFDQTQMKVAFLLMDLVEAISQLDSAKRKRFAELFLQLTQLWDAVLEEAEKNGPAGDDAACQTAQPPEAAPAGLP